MRHESYELKQMQSLPLEAKIIMTQQRIRQWYEHWDGEVCVSFSGGKDSTVLKHIVDGMYDDVPALFVNTGLEYPELQSFVRNIKAGKYECFNSNIEIVRPEMRFDEVLKVYGYPVISKTVANKVEGAKPGNTRWLQLKGGFLNPKNGEYSQFNIPKWGFLLDADFKISDKCCTVMKKRPAKKYTKESGRKPMLGMMASESKARRDAWMKTGCNAFDLKEPQSQPMAFWTEQDVLEYIRRFNVPYATVYGDIVSEDGKLKTTGCSRSGCLFCAFGCHLERGQNRFQKLKETHPRQYEYCIKGGERWQTENGFQIKKVWEWVKF